METLDIGRHVGAWAHLEPVIGCRSKASSVVESLYLIQVFVAMKQKLRMPLRLQNDRRQKSLCMSIKNSAKDNDKCPVVYVLLVSLFFALLFGSSCTPSCTYKLRCQLYYDKSCARILLTSFEMAQKVETPCVHLCFLFAEMKIKSLHKRASSYCLIR